MSEDEIVAGYSQIENKNDVNDDFDDKEGRN